ERYSFDTLRFALATESDMTGHSNKSGSISAPPAANRDAPTAHDAKNQQTSPESSPVPQEARKPKRKRKLVIAALGIAVLVALIVVGIPLAEEMLNTVSTDDAFVNGHVTFVARSVAGQISRVLVDDNT